MGTVQKVLLYGGTFDPPHNGHMNNLRAALELVRPDKAIVMPAGIPPHKKARRGNQFLQSFSNINTSKQLLLLQ